MASAVPFDIGDESCGRFVCRPGKGFVGNDSMKQSSQAMHNAEYDQILGRGKESGYIRFVPAQTPAKTISNASQVAVGLLCLRADSVVDLLQSLLSGYASLRDGVSIISIAILLLMLRPHLLTTHLLLVVHWTSAVRPLHTLLLVVQLRVRVAVTLIRVRVRVVTLLLTVEAMMR